MEQFFEFVVNHWVLWLGLVFILVMIIVVELRDQLTGAKAITPQAAVNLLNHENAVIWDIRSADAYQSGHIINSKNMNIEKSSPNDQDKNAPLILVCENGQQSAKAAEKFKKSGFDKIMSIKGGITAWKNSDLPLIKK